MFVATLFLIETKLNFSTFTGYNEIRENRRYMIKISSGLKDLGRCFDYIWLYKESRMVIA